MHTKTVQVSLFVLVLGWFGSGFAEVTPRFEECLQLGSGESGRYEPISMISLLVDDFRWDGKNIQTVGVLRYSWEGSALCVRPEDIEHFTYNCYPLPLGWTNLVEASGGDEDGVYRVLEAWHGRYVFVYGRVEAGTDERRGRLADVTSVGMTKPPEGIVRRMCMPKAKD